MNNLKLSAPLLLERNIRERIMIGSFTFEPQIKAILKKIDQVASISLKFESEIQDFTLSFQCPFCPKSFTKACYVVYHLLFIHKNLSFTFKLKPIDNNRFGLVIQAERKKKHEISNFAFIYRCKPKRNTKGMRYELKLSVQNILKKAFSEENEGKKKSRTGFVMNFMSDSEDEKQKKDLNSLSKEEIKRKLEGKTFYHSNNIMQPIKDDSLFEESELDIDDKPIRESEEKAIGDFEDIDETDKEFFKLWNNFVRDFNAPKKRNEDIRNLRLVAFCKRDYKMMLSEFVNKNKEILGKLRYNFVMHLVTFQIYGLINGNDILQLLLELDEKQNIINNPIFC